MGFPWRNWTILPFLSLPFEIFPVGFIIHVILCAYCGMLFMIIIYEYHHSTKLASFPGLLRFYLPFAFTTIHGEKWGRPGSIHHVSGHEVDIGGEGPIFKYIRTKVESEFLTGQDK